MLVLSLGGRVRTLDKVGPLSVKDTGARGDAERSITPPLARLNFREGSKRDVQGD